MKIIFFALFLSIISTGETLDQNLKSILLEKYSHLFSHLIKRIERKIKKIERRKEALKKRREMFLPPMIPPPPMIIGGPFPIHPPFFRNRSFHFFKPHPHFHFFKNFSTISKTQTPEGIHGIVNITKEFPGKDGQLIV